MTEQKYDIGRIVASPRHDWTEDLIRENKAPGIYGEPGPDDIVPNLEPYDCRPPGRSTEGGDG